MAISILFYCKINIIYCLYNFFCLQFVFIAQHLPLYKPICPSNNIRRMWDRSTCNLGTRIRGEHNNPFLKCGFGYCRGIVFLNWPEDSSKAFPIAVVPNLDMSRRGDSPDSPRRMAGQVGKTALCFLRNAFHIRFPRGRAVVFWTGRVDRSPSLSCWFVDCRPIFADVIGNLRKMADRFLGQVRRSGICLQMSILPIVSLFWLDHHEF